MFSWQLWRLLHSPIKGYGQRLVPQSLNDSKNDTVFFFGIVLWLVSCGICYFVVIPISIAIGLNFFSIQAAWQISGTVARQHEMGRWELIAVTEIGSLGIIFDLCSYYAQATNQNVKDITKVLLSCVALICGVLLIGSLIVPTAIFIVFFLIAMLVVGSGMILFEYHQSFVLGNLIGIFASRVGERTNARMLAMVSLLVVQLMCYGVPIIVWYIVNQFYNLWVINPFLLIFVAVIVLASLHVTREIIIHALWRQVLLRFNDDIPVLNVKGKRG
jgi:hypothetical protein